MTKHDRATDHPRDGALPAPAFLAEALLRLGWGAEAGAVSGDVAEALAARRQGDGWWTGGPGAWLWGWGQVLAAVAHGLGGRRGRGPGFRPWLALRLAVRGLLRDRSTSLTAVGTLALGLAAPATFFSLLVGAIRPLPVPQGERVMRVEVVQPEREGRALTVTAADLRGWADAGTLSGLGGFRETGATLVDPGVVATRLAMAELTPGVLPLLRVSPVLGRVPDADEADEALLLGHAVWTEVFDADPGVIGRVVEVDGRPRTVTGVLPEGFGFPLKQDAWTILPLASAGDAPLEPVLRLANGASPEAAAAELQGRWARRDVERDPDQSGGVVQVERYTSGRGETGEAVAFIGLVLVAVCLLLIACANVANLLLVRATERVRLLGVQAALGAGRMQIGVQLFLEALLLAVAGGAVGLVLAHWAVGYVQRTMGPANFGYYWMRMAVDGSVVAFTLALVTLTALTAGLIPVVRVLRTDLQRTLKDQSASGAVGGGGRWSRAFVTLQLALSCGALVAASLTARTMSVARDFGRGLPGEQTLVATLQPGTGALAVDDHAILEAVARVPGARNVALALGAPGGGGRYGPLEEEGVTYERPGDRPTLAANAVTPSFFQAMDLDVLAGRALGDADDASAPPVAVVNEAFVRRFSPGRDVLGRRFRVPSLDSTWATVVGVVETADLGAGPTAREERIYLSFAQVDVPTPTLVVRAEGDDGAALAPAVRRAVAEVDPRLPVTGVRTLADLFRFMTRAQATLGFLGASGGFAGLLVAVVGLYGLLAFRVRQRRRELGVRMALGADGRRVAAEVLRSAFRQLVPATVVGLALAWLASPLLAAFTLGSDPRSPAMYVAVGAAFLALGALAALAPALRAARTDPARALHGE